MNEGLTDGACDDLIVLREGRAGRLRLNRPRALHALTTAMCRQIVAALDEWESDPAVAAVVIDHAEGRGFCAGGDIRVLTDSAGADGAAAREFFLHEYRTDHQLATYAKPVVAFMDGVTMGGGVGISQPARFKVATANTRFAMPETGIGLIPDVGGGWFLSRLPGRIGAFLGLTGHRLDGAECVALGLCTHYLPTDALELAKGRIAERPEAIAAILDELAVPPPAPRILAERERIDRLFAGDRLEDIVAALAADGGEWAEKQLAVLAARSPLMLKATLRLLAEGAAMPDFAAELRQEYAIITRAVFRPDFSEGVRALIVDKDMAPRWSPATPGEATAAMVDALFVPLPPERAWTPHPGVST